MERWSAVRARPQEPARLQRVHAAISEMSEPEPEPEPEPELLGEGSGGDDEPEAVVESQVPGGMETPTKQPHGRLPPLDVRPMPAVEEDDKLADDLMFDGQAEAALNRGAAEQPQTAAGDFLYVQRE